jgi:2-C-methyl-D-erythritol 4-phosphate cytidylyltransferase
LPRDVGVILVAAGKGERAGAGPPKQYREIGGVPMLLRSLRPFASHPDVAEIVVALPPPDAPAPPAWLAELGEGVRVVPGGETRTASVSAALGALGPACGIVLVHDAARPFVERATIDAVIAEARRGHGAVAAVPLSDTVKEAAADGDGLDIARTVPRERLWRAQTPQGFPRDLLSAAYAEARIVGSPATDDATLVERTGHTVRLVPDSPGNFKVTSADDFALAELRAGKAP